jgi:hypothetical protein
VMPSRIGPPIIASEINNHFAAAPSLCRAK